MIKDVDKLLTIVLMNAIVKKRAVIGKNVFNVRHSSEAALSFSAMSVMTFLSGAVTASNLFATSDTTPDE